MNIPLTITRAANAVGVTNANYIETFFNSFADLAFRQYPFIQCLSNVEVSLNDTPISMISDMADCFEAVSEYYDENEIDEQFQASQPDRFYSYSHYVDQPQSILTKDLNGNTTRYLISSLSNENVFTGGYSNRYNSRRPVSQCLVVSAQLKI
jgi:hypothetical protein